MSAAFTHFLGVLDDIRVALTTPEGPCPLTPQPCRTAVYPGGEVPFDACGESCGDGREGQFWVNLQPATVTTDVAPCRRFTLTAQIGITRCSAMPANDGTPPSPDAVAANAWQQALDADTIADAINCCTVTDESRHNVTITGWSPFDNQGGCYGGFFTVVGTYDVCCS